MSFPKDMTFTIPTDVFFSVDVERMGPKDILTIIKQKLTTIHWPSDWIVQNFPVEIPVETYDKFTSHEIVMFCCNNLFANPKNKYWIMTLPMDSPHIMSERKINFNIFTKTQIVSRKLQTSVFFENNRIGVLHGYPFCFFLLDKQFSTKEEYLWGEVRLPLEFIIEDLQDKLADIEKPPKLTALAARVTQLEDMTAKKADREYTEANLTDMNERIENIESKTDALDSAIAWARTIHLSLPEEHIKKTIENQGTSWWATLVGGLGGGALSGLGSVLSSVIDFGGDTENDLAKSVSNNALNSVDNVLSRAGTSLED